MKIKLHSGKNLIIFFICAGMAAYDIVAAWGTRDWFWLAVGVFFAVKVTNLFQQLTESRLLMFSEQIPISLLSFLI